jgi:phospholipid/cholesterol/gamma-HCH transport system substrate-binding protein
MNMSRYAKIALFFIVLGTAGGVFIVTSADGLGDFNTRTYEVVIPDATGLSSRSKIYLAGVAVGRVRSISLSENEAVLQIGILKNVQVREGAQLTRKSSSILGTSVLVLVQGIELSPVIPPGSRIGSAKESGSIDDMMDTVQGLGGQISQLLRDFQDNQLALLAISLETFNSVAQKINAQTDAELERVSRILEAMALITERMERVMARGEDYGTGPVADINVVLENIRMITDEVRLGQGSIGQVIYDEQLYAGLLSVIQRVEVAALKLQETLDSINSAAQNADNVIVNANEIVERALNLGIQVDTFGIYHTMAKQVQAGASIRLNPASNDRWYKIGVSSVPSGFSTRTVTTTIENGVLKTEDVTETKYTFAVDAEIARRFGILTFRGGLFENTAGLGLDIQPLNWLNVSGDVFNFRTGESPNLRGTITLFPFFDPESDKPWHWIYLKGGINDSLTDKRDFFVGGGVRFADREIKGLVGLVPAFGN